MYMCIYKYIYIYREREEKDSKVSAISIISIVTQIFGPTSFKQGF